MNLTGFRTSLRPNTFVAETKSSSEEGTSGPRWPPWMPYLMKQAIPKYQVALFIYRLAHGCFAPIRRLRFVFLPLCAAEF